MGLLRTVALMSHDWAPEEGSGGATLLTCIWCGIDRDRVVAADILDLRPCRGPHKVEKLIERFDIKNAVILKPLLTPLGSK